MSSQGYVKPESMDPDPATLSKLDDRTPTNQNQKQAKGPSEAREQEIDQETQLKLRGGDEGGCCGCCNYSGSAPNWDILW